MTRSILAVIAAGLSVGILSGTGCKQTGVGDPCTPEQEYNVNFNGFNANEVNVESKSFQCQTRLCLVNHFQGRVSCPYGQDISGNTVSGAKKACAVPGGDPANGNDKIVGNPSDAKTGATVQPQCQDRLANDTVYCSCRCANINGKTDDGANYCTCPDGFACTQLVSSIGAGDTGLTGAYCIKNGTGYPGPNSACTKKGPCDPNDAAATKACGNAGNQLTQ